MKTSRRISSRKDGFTLIELLVVVAIIAILAALSMGGMQFVNQLQNRNKAELQIKLLQMSLEEYKADTGLYPLGESANGTGNTKDIFNVLFPTRESEDTIYLDQLDPLNDNQQWLDGQKGDEDLIIYDPWGTEYYYRANDPAQPNISVAANPDFDLWSAGPDKRTTPGSEGNYDPKHPDNKDDIRGW